jgi:cell division protein FtsI (penicillin-binding protein 3)
LNDALVPIAPSHVRAWLILLVFTSIASLLIWRLDRLMRIDTAFYQHLATRQQMRTWRIPAARGSIFDRDGQPLAMSEQRWSLFADPDYMDEKLTATIALSDLLGLSRQELRKHFTSGSNGRLLARGLTEAQKTAVAELDLAGIYTRPHYLRTYPQGSVAANVLGFLRRDDVGGAGLESRFEVHLAGNPGKRIYRVDARGRKLANEVDERQYEPPLPGQHIQLTLDSRLQQRAEARLAEAIKHHQASTGAVVALRPATGEILALASWPSFDLVQARDNGVDSLAKTRNQAIQIVYESGSTMKPLVAGATVAEGLAGWDERVFCENGAWTYRHGRAARTIHDHSYKHGGHQWLTVAEGVAKSDNVLMAKLGVRMGPERLYAWTKRLGFGEPTGIDLPGESSGVVFPLSRWTWTGACMSVPIGHEFSVTPLQMALAHAAVANAGVWNAPSIINRIFSIDPRTSNHVDITVPPVSSPRRIYRRDDASRIQAAMRLVMEEGTGSRLQLDGYSSAGKTGTTEKLIGGRYSSDRHIGSFVGWAPAVEIGSAELLILALIDDPQENGHYGSQTAGPVVRDLLQYGLADVLRVPFDQLPEDVP